MKKKILKIVGATIILMSCLSTIFVLRQTENEMNTSIFELSGTWKIYQKGDDTVEQEYLTFSNQQLEDYRENKLEPYLKTDYTYDEQGSLVLAELDKVLKITPISKNIAILTEQSGLEWKIFRVENMDENGIAVSEILLGKWNVALHGTQPVDEILVFTENQITDYRNGNTTPYMESNYIWKDESNIIQTLGKEFGVYPVNSETLILQEYPENYIWELKKDSI